MCTIFLFAATAVASNAPFRSCSHLSVVYLCKMCRFVSRKVYKNYNMCVCIKSVPEFAMKQRREKKKRTENCIKSKSDEILKIPFKVILSAARTEKHACERRVFLFVYKQIILHTFCSKRRNHSHLL